MKVAVYNEAYECKVACTPLDKVVRKDKFEEATQFLKETGRFWFKENGELRYLTHVEG